MKILNAEEFAAKVMENGTEVEPNEYETMGWQKDVDQDETVWTIYAHIDADGNLVHSNSDAEWTITTSMELNREQSEALMNGNLDDTEKEVIINELYPQYIETLKENEEWINL